MVKNFLILLCFIQCLLGANWYVDNTATSGSNDGTSWENAWTNFASISWKKTWIPTSKVGHGDILYISGGTISKTYSETLVISVNDGVTNSYLKIMCGQEGGHSGKVIIDVLNLTNCVEWNANDWIHFDGQVGNDFQRHILLANAADASPSTSKGYATKGQILDSIVEYIEVTNCINGIQVSTTAGYRNTIRNCKITGIYGGGAVLIGTQDGGVSDSFVQNCEIGVVYTNVSTGYGADGIQISGGVTVSNCFIYGQLGTNTLIQHQDGIQHLGANVKVEACTFSNLINSACESTGNDTTKIGATNITFINNVVKWCSSDATNGYPRGFEWVPHVGQGNFTDYLIANNTFVDFPRWAAIRFNLTVSGAETNGLARISIYNNIIVNCGNNTIGAIMIDEGANVDTNTINIDYNSLTKGSASTSNTNILVNGITISQANSVSQPTFTYYVEYSESNNLIPTSSSQGTNMAAYYSKDILGKVRGNSGLWSIGAYEYIYSAIYFPFLKP